MKNIATEAAQAKRSLTCRRSPARAWEPGLLVFGDWRLRTKGRFQREHLSRNLPDIIQTSSVGYGNLTSSYQPEFYPSHLHPHPPLRHVLCRAGEDGDRLFKQCKSLILSLAPQIANVNLSDDHSDTE